MRWSEVRELLRQDRDRLLGRLASHGTGRPGFLWLYPPMAAVALYRISRFFLVNRHRVAARFVWQLNVLLTGADVDPASDVAGGLVLLNPVAISLTGKAGRNLTMGAVSGLGIVASEDDIGGGPGHPVLGDDVEISPHAAVFGPVRVGSRVFLGGGVIVTRDVPEDSVVLGYPPRFHAGTSAS